MPSGSSSGQTGVMVGLSGWSASIAVRLLVHELAAALMAAVPHRALTAKRTSPTSDPAIHRVELC